MSRIGRKPLEVPKGVQVTITPDTISTKGPKGTLTLKRHRDIEIKQAKDDDKRDVIVFERKGNGGPERAAHGLMRALVSNMVKGVTEGLTRQLEINGVGFLALNLLKIIGKVFFRLEVKGIENIPALPYIITPNHASNIDGFVTGTVVPTKTYMSLYFLGFQKYFSNWFTSRFARLAHVIPIDPETHLKRALLISGYVLENRKALCLFPEGGRTFDGKLLPFKKGVGILSKELDVPLVPTLIQGTFEVLPRGSIWPKFKKIRVTFGKPIYPKEIDLRPSTRTCCPSQYQKKQSAARGLASSARALGLR